MNHDELLKKFGKNVKVERIKKDYSQDKLATILGVNENYVSKIECGKQNMSLKKIALLADALDVNIEALLKFKD